MADRSFTLVELHLHDGVRLSVAGQEVVEPGDKSDDRDEEGGGDGTGAGTGRRRARMAAALLIAAAAVLALLWRLTEGDLDAARELDET